MTDRLLRPLLALLIFLCLLPLLKADDAEHAHHHGDHAEQEVERPKVFLDKSERIVWYQLDRLENPRLLLVERNTEDPKYIPVYTAILIRSAISPQYREEALQALVAINKSDPVAELLTAIDRLAQQQPFDARTGYQLAGMLLAQPEELLKKNASGLAAEVESKLPFERQLAMAAQARFAQEDSFERVKVSNPETHLDWLKGIRLLPQQDLRNELRGRVTQFLQEGNPSEVRQEAIRTLATITEKQRETFALLAPLATKPNFRDSVVPTLLTIPAEKRDPELSATLAEQFVKLAETTPAAKRTSDEFLRAMQFTDQLLAALPVESARQLRARLREVTVRVVLIHTVEEEMRYDVPYFAVEAGRPVQVVLKNEDLMPHNLVITVPGALQKVAEDGLAIGPDGGTSGKAYVPDSPDVMHATVMVQPRQQDRLTFNAPTEPGEYPYVCTFPRHWMRMYGVMVVVPDLDEWLKNPTVPKDPVGSDRKFVQSWKQEDFQDGLAEGLRGRSPDIGARLFKEATCQLCHKFQNEGGAVGPDLTEVYKRWKGDDAAVLREILDPSYRIDDKYAIHTIVTIDGEIASGMVTAQNKEQVEILENPEAKQPRVIPREDIEEMVKTSKSMMPKALLDRFTRDEILEILAYLKSGQPAGE